ncbi:hypothetical protein N5P37_011290 [Trichoderma harzianum]|uniref:Uncharacterized protein n=1 Tax=Trichoderma harzianum CBS 226.95 TaxID=983964 RepID=A0A2T3ZWK1_TRIHA|nr:hypothetical protein M431DRAFT_98432 [Trichoderma harzianum CBS 226.95]KAK0756078.1 hypothetical protein N5P37_011290 [Trichoderma harzianum]PKK42718.1 hypothetical protein CI102_13191 [Trichoderma harzianum]PTB49196.1 hypothetical protein M431DRAFT_98432 [Trichoderma harzianum CBS 226.95]
MTKFVTALRRPLQNDRHNIKSTQEWRNNEPQRIPGDYLVPERLEAALKKNWQNQYAVEMRSNEYRIRAPGKLSDNEIRTCYSPGY